jgi:hypothetical protein
MRGCTTPSIVEYNQVPSLLDRSLHTNAYKYIRSLQPSIGIRDQPNGARQLLADYDADYDDDDDADDVAHGYDLDVELERRS